MMIAVLLAAAVAGEPPTDAKSSAAPSPPAAAPPSVASAAKDEIVCHNEVVSGSRLPEKVCMRASEAQRRRQTGRDALEKFQNANGQRGPNGS